MDKETNVQRVLNMIYHICGCNDEEALEVLHACEDKIVPKEDKRIKELETKAKDSCWEYCYEQGLTKAEQKEYEELVYDD